MKIVYAATPEISISCLEKLLNSSHELSLILTMPDKPSGRGKKLIPGPIKKSVSYTHLTLPTKRIV